MEATYQVTIQAVENGFVVRVGCRLFVSEKWDNVAEQLTAYFTGQETEFIKAQISKNPTAQAPMATMEAAPQQDLRDSLAR